MNRREMIGTLALLPLAAPALGQGATARVTVVGGGFGGAAAARALRRADPGIAVTLIEREAAFQTCPFSNGVIAGLWPEERTIFGFDGLAAEGIEIVHDAAVGIDPATRAVTLAGGRVVESDSVILSPGITLDYDKIDGYSAEAAEIMPHAWKAGPQTRLLRDQIVAMPDGGVVVIAIPRPPFRCPPGPYERISLIAHYLSVNKPGSRIVVLDAQDSFSKQPLFEEAWSALYPGMIERIPGAMSGEVIAVDPAAMRVMTGFDEVAADVANIIPPQRAGRIALDAGLDDGLGWCPVDPVTFESVVAPGIHVIGDAAIAGEMPKSAFSAHQQALACADAVAARIAGAAVHPRKMINTCYSLAAPDYGFSIADVFEQRPEGIVSVMTLPKTTAVGASDEVHRAEAEFAGSWFDTLTSQVW